MLSLIAFIISLITCVIVLRNYMEVTKKPKMKKLLEWTLKLIGILSLWFIGGFAYYLGRLVAENIFG